MTDVPILVPGVESLPIGLVRSSALVVVGVPTEYTEEDGFFFQINPSGVSWHW